MRASGSGSRARVVIPVTLLLCLLGLRPGAPTPPALLVVITVDQLRPDYLSRFEGEWTGGFHRLLGSGATFLNGLQDHAITETAPGHATVLSGRDPARTGIVNNTFGVSDTSVRLLGAREGTTGASPRRFEGTTLVDWMTRRDPGMRFLSVSAKDRSAILVIGRSRGPVYWYDANRFTTSTWYADSLPDWVRAWHARRGIERLAGASWTPLRSDSTYREPDDQPWENDGRNETFPHAFPDDPERVAHVLPDSPWIDSLTLDLALDGARALGLGRRPGTDLVAVGLSATDHVGHRFGPESRELHDHLLRVDLWLGRFLDSLDVLAGDRRLLVVLTADHGVTDFPERARSLGRPGGRIGLGAFVREVNQAIGRRTGEQAMLKAGSGIIFGDRERLRQLGVNPESLATALLPRVWRLPGVQNAWTPATLGGAVPTDPHAARWSRTLPPKFSWLVAAQAAVGYIWSDGGGHTTHGTTNADDVGVPIIFAGPGIRAGRFPDSVRTVDIAPTLARVLGVRTEGKLDGRRIKHITD